MGFPSSNVMTTSDAWLSSRAWAGKIKTTCQQFVAESAAGDMPSSRVWQVDTLIYDGKLVLDQARLVPGIGAYSKEQMDNPAYDVGTAYTAMTAQITNTLAWIDANFPKDGSGYVLDRKRDAERRFVDRMFTPAGLAGLRTVLNQLIATID